MAPTKGARTREQIAELAAPLFNQRGYSGVSIADVMDATGLQTGGIYRHFENKEELAVGAFDHAVDVMAARFQAALAQAPRMPHFRLLAVISVYADLPQNPPVPGGCPVLNAAVDNDDGNPALRKRARVAVQSLERLIVSLLERGQEDGDYLDATNTKEMASVIVASVEGAVAVARLAPQSEVMKHVVAHLRSWLESQLSAEGKRRLRRVEREAKKGSHAGHAHASEPFAALDR